MQNRIYRTTGVVVITLMIAATFLGFVVGCGREGNPMADSPPAIATPEQLEAEAQLVALLQEFQVKQQVESQPAPALLGYFRRVYNWMSDTLPFAKAVYYARKGEAFRVIEIFLDQVWWWGWVPEPVKERVVSDMKNLDPRHRYGPVYDELMR